MRAVTCGNREIYDGPMFFELDQARSLLEFYRDYIKDAPEEMGGFPAFQIAPPLPFIPEDRHGEMFVIFVARWAGPVEEGEKASSRSTTWRRSSRSTSGPCPIPPSTARSIRFTRLGSNTTGRLTS